MDVNGMQKALYSVKATGWFFQIFKEFAFNFTAHKYNEK